MSQLMANPLSDKYSSITCHSTADLVTKDKIEGRSTEQLREKLFNCEFLQHVTPHSKSQDKTAALTELSNVIIDTPTPEAIGMNLVRRIDLGTEIKKVRIREPAIAAGTGRARAARGRGGRSKYVELKPDTEEESHSSWDLKFLEDADWSVAMEETALISQELQEKISQLIIDKLLSSAGSTEGTTVAFTAILNARARMRARHVTPDCLVVDPMDLSLIHI